jgi:hypothetical protein
VSQNITAILRTGAGAGPIWPLEFYARAAARRRDALQTCNDPASRISYRGRLTIGGLVSSERGLGRETR